VLLSKTLVAQGWTDALRKLYLRKRSNILDYFRNAYGRNAGLRIDHFCQPKLDNVCLPPVLTDVRGWKRPRSCACVDELG